MVVILYTYILNIMARQAEFNDFERFLNFIFSNIQKIENDEYIFLNIFADSKKYDKQFFDKILNENFNKQEIDIHFPDIIITENKEDLYYVGKDAYDKNIEYFTVRIKK